MRKQTEKNTEWFVNKLLRLFRDMPQTEIDEIFEIFKANEGLRVEGYGWKPVDVMCIATTKCGWKGRRIWGEKMFDEPCPWCKFISKDGHTSVTCPVKVQKS